MNWLPQYNGDRVEIPNCQNYRRTFEAFNFHAAFVSSTTLIMERQGPDSVVFAGCEVERANVTAEYAAELKRVARRI